MTVRRTRPAAVPLLALLAALACLLGLAPPASAASAYRYWSFWERTDAGAWRYATRGPALARPGDGDTAGFRFAVSEDTGDASRPRGGAGFAAVCADTKARAGEKRVGLVVDFGTAADAPSGERPPRPRTACARVPSGASAADALAAVAKPLRYDSAALLCGIAGYPRHGCGEQVAAPSRKAPGDSAGEAPAHDDGGGPSLGIYAGLGVLVVLTAGIGWQTRRRRQP
ncbi:SCO2322 family protein [Streptomyces sp. SPB074]|uniref:SCO2322 family protein n=1 Tax=Streptomyces sp. (strain SPB074) TaxID=465543 RepID=UPI0001D1DB7D|nr:SCO2322 family protein [Streptomyces sp. SPB074]EDY42630.2 secreted protein [Streptomyces sp. SPB074]